MAPSHRAITARYPLGSTFKRSQREAECNNQEYVPKEWIFQRHGTNTEGINTSTGQDTNIHGRRQTGSYSCWLHQEVHYQYVLRADPTKMAEMPCSLHRSQEEANPTTPKERGLITFLNDITIYSAKILQAMRSVYHYSIFHFTTLIPFQPLRSLPLQIFCIHSV